LFSFVEITDNKENVKTVIVIIAIIVNAILFIFYYLKNYSEEMFMPNEYIIVV
jgi:hypothetical protein